MELVVVVVGGVTETLQATPLLRTLRAGLPEAHLRLLCPDTAAEVADGIPAVDSVVAMHALRGTATAAAGAWVWRELRRRRVDAVLLCSGASALRSAGFLAGVPERLGPAGGASSLLLSARSPEDPHENRAPAWLRLAGLLGVRRQLNAPAFEPGPEARREADRLVHGTGLADGRLLVALSPGGGLGEEADGVPAAATIWESERYALLANQLAARHGAGAILLGTAADRPVIERTMLDLGTLGADLSGDLRLRVVAGVLARCDLLVSGDSPMLHLAAAVGTPAVGLFGPTSGRRRGPYGSDHRIIQGLPASGSRQGGMERIRVEDVLASIEATL